MKKILEVHFKVNNTEKKCLCINRCENNRDIKLNFKVHYSVEVVECLLLPQDVQTCDALKIN
jgi:hypothetical protein